MGSSPTKNLKLPQQKDIYDTGNDKGQEEKVTDNNAAAADVPQQKQQVKEKKKKVREFKHITFYAQLAQGFSEECTKIFLHPTNWDWLQKEAELKIDRTIEVEGVKYFLYKVSIPVPLGPNDQLLEYFYSVTTTYLEEVEVEQDSPEPDDASDDSSESSTLDDKPLIISIFGSDSAKDSNTEEKNGVGKRLSDASIRAEVGSERGTVSDEEKIDQNWKRETIPKEKQYKESHLTVNEDVVRNLRVNTFEDDYSEVYDCVVPHKSSLSFKEKYVAKQALLPTWQMIGSVKVKKKVLPMTFIQLVDKIMQRIKYPDTDVQVMKDFISKVPSLQDISSERGRVCSLSTALVVICLNYKYSADHDLCKDHKLIQWLMVKDPSESDEIKSYFPDQLRQDELNALLEYWWKCVAIAKLVKETLFSITLLHYLPGFCAEGDDIETRSTEYTDPREALQWWGVKESAQIMSYLLKKSLSKEQGPIALSKEDLDDIRRMASVNPMMWRTVIYPFSVKEMEAIHPETLPLHIWVAKWYQLLQTSHPIKDDVFMETLTNALKDNLDRSKTRSQLNKSEISVTLECVRLSVKNPSKTLSHLTAAVTLIDQTLQVQKPLSTEAQICECVNYFQGQLTKLYEAKIEPQSAIELPELEFFCTVLNGNQSMKNEENWTNKFTATLIKRLQRMKESCVLSTFCSKQVQHYFSQLPVVVSEQVEGHSIQICKTFKFTDITACLYKLAAQRDGDRRRILKLLFIGGFKGESTDDVRELVLKEEFIQIAEFAVQLGVQTIPEELKLSCTFLQNLLEQMISGEILFEDLEFILHHQNTLIPVILALFRLKWISPSNMSEWIDTDETEELNNLPLKLLIALRRKELHHYKMIRENVDVYLSLLDLIPPVASPIERRDPVQYLHQACKPLDAKDKYNKNELPKIIVFQEISDSTMQIVTKIKAAGLNKVRPFQLIWIDVRQKLVDENAELYEIQQEDVVEKVAKPALCEWDRLMLGFKDRTISLGEIEKYFGDCFGDDAELEKLLHLVNVKGLEQLFTHYRSILLFKRAADVLMKVKDLHEIASDFKELELLQDWCNDKMVQLKDIDADIETLVPSEIFIDTFRGCEAVDCVDVFTKCHSLVKWVHRNIRSEKEVKTLIDLAMSASGQEPIELQKAACLRSALGGYAPLIFRLKPDDSFHDVVNHCNLVVQNLKTDPALPSKLDDCQRLLEWIKHIRKSQGLVEMDAVSQIQEINEKSTLAIAFNGKGQDSNTSIQVMVHGSDISYNKERLMDLQNKVMLVSNDDIATKEQVQTYQQTLEQGLLIAKLGGEMVDTGCLIFNSCKVKLVRKQEEPALTSVVLGGTKASHVGLEGDCLNAILQVFKECQVQWTRYIEGVRNSFYFVNRFTNEQMKLLRGSFAKWTKITKGSVDKTLLLLQSINPDITSEAIEDCVKKVTPHYGIDVSKTFPVASSRIRTFGEEMNSAAVVMCSRYNASEHNCLSLSHAAEILESIGTYTKTAKQFDTVGSLAKGNPNLILCSPDEMINTVVSIYKYYSKSTLPTDGEVLYCTADTGFEEINLLWKRAFSPLGASKVFCLVNADLVRFEVADSAIKVFDACRKQNKDFQIVVICNRMNQHISHFVTCLEPFKRQIVVEDSSKLKGYLLDCFKKASNDADPHGSSVTLVTSKRAGMGKTLKIQSLAVQCDGYMKVPVTDPCPKEADVADTLMVKGLNTGHKKRLMVHLDISHEVSQNVDMILFKLLYLGSLTTSEGYKWMKQPNHYMVIENVPLTKAVVHTDEEGQDKMVRYIRILELLPEIHCWAPEAVIQNQSHGRYTDQLINADEFGKEEIQVPVAYLRMMENKKVTFGMRNTWRNDTEDLKLIQRHCGISNCAWSEMQAFLSFLYTQLKDCEESSFCQIGSDDDQDLPGFGFFVVKFMLKMCQDFATRSLQIAENERGELSRARLDVAEGFLEDMAVKRTWETSPHPYIFFNCDPKTKSRTTFSFMGFRVDRTTGDLIDPSSGGTLERSIMSHQLFDSLERNGVNLSEVFDNKPRLEKIRTLCDIMGIKSTSDPDPSFVLTTDNVKKILAIYMRFRLEKIRTLCDIMGIKSTSDPDPSFVLTTDNVKKILAIYMRFRCNIPVIIMGETGCGKTRLIKFMCDLQKPDTDKNLQNMIIVKVHGGTTRHHIAAAVQNALAMCEKNKQHCTGMETVLFFDEANTTPCICFLKEIICDRSVNGIAITDASLKIIAAVNPYRRHTTEMITKLEKAGLGYHVSAKDTADCLGDIPMRELVYRVQPLPERMLHMVWDFGQLSEKTEASYISEMVQKDLSQCDKGPYWDPQMTKIIIEVLQASQRYMRQQKDECKFVSLRDIERALTILKWFHSKRKVLFHCMNQKTNASRSETPNDWTRALMLTLGVCYHASLSNRKSYSSFIEGYFKGPCKIQAGFGLKQEIERCQDVFMDNIKMPETIAKNKALKENIFMMVVCIELRIPLFLVGRPGSSKSLAKAMVMDAMQGKLSPSDIFRDLKEVQMISYQCSPLSTAEGIVNTFNQCAKLQEENDLRKYTSVVILDEVGLAEDSPQMPLKSLHALLEDGCEGTDKPKPHQKVAFIGISNWALDPAKMNRGILVQRKVPDIKDLIKTAKGICKNKNEVPVTLMRGFAESYHELQCICEADKEFFGLRDYYGLIKMVHAFSQKHTGQISWEEIKYAVLRNFGGLASVNPVEIFQKRVDNTAQEYSTDPDCAEMKLILDGVRGENLGMPDSVSRYTLIIVENLGMLGILQTHFMEEKTIVLYGSSFPMDQDYSQICRNINKIKGYMETGKKVVLLNLDNLYESLYDCLNQYYVELAGDKFVDLGLGNHRVKCRVDPEFRVSLLAEKNRVYEKYPVALINRLEKHFLSASTILDPNHARIVLELEMWIQNFITVENSTDNIGPENVFVGYHPDAIGSVVFQTINKLSIDADVDRAERKAKILKKSKKKILQCATPDGILRLKLTNLQQEDKDLAQRYFLEQEHASLLKFQKEKIKLCQQQKQLFFEVTTHSRLMSHTELEGMCQKLNMQRIGTSMYRTDRNARNISRGTGSSRNMNMKQMLLNKYDTEQQFRKDLREFISNTSETGLLLVQCEAGHMCQNLIACAQFIIWDEYQEMQNTDKSFIILLIVQIPRYAVKRFTGFHGGKWDSWHIDELLQDSNQMVDVAKIQDKTVCQLMHDALENSTETAFDLDVLLLETVHVACSRIIDLQDNLDRKEARLYCVLALLKSETVPAFRQSFKGRILKLIEDKYAFKRTLSLNPDFEKEWLYKRVCKVSHITKTASLRRAIWNYLQEEVCTLMTGLIAYIDTHNNLDVVEHANEHLVATWMNLFTDSGVTDCSYTEKFITMPSNSELQRHRVVSEQRNGRHFTGSFPFSFVVVKIVNKLIDIEERQTTDTDHILKSVQGVFKGLPVGQHLEAAMRKWSPKEMCKMYIHDFVRMFYLPSNTEAFKDLEYEMIEKEIYDCLPYEDIPAVHVTFRQWKDRVENFKRLLTFEENVISEIQGMKRPAKAGRHFSLDLLALQVITGRYQPQISKTGFENIDTWIHRVSNASAFITTVVSVAERSMQNHKVRVTELNKIVEDIRGSWLHLEVVSVYAETTAQNMAEVQCLWKDLHNQASASRILDVLITAVTQTHKKLVIDNMGKKFLKCVYCDGPVFEAWILKKCKHVYCHMCIVTVSSQQPHCCASRCQAAFKGTEINTPTDQKHKKAEEQIMRLKQAFQDLFMRVLLLLYRDDRPMESAVCDMLFRLVTDQGTPIPILCDRTEADQSFRLFLLQFHFLKNNSDCVVKVNDFIQQSLIPGSASQRGIAHALFGYTLQCIEDKHYLEGDLEKSIVNWPQELQRISECEHTQPADFVQTLEDVAIIRYIVRHVSAGITSSNSLGKNLRACLELLKILNCKANDLLRHYFVRYISKTFGQGGLDIAYKIDPWLFPEGRETSTRTDVFGVYGEQYLQCKQLLIRLWVNKEDTDNKTKLKRFMNDTNQTEKRGLVFTLAVLQIFCFSTLKTDFPMEVMEFKKDIVCHTSVPISDKERGVCADLLSKKSLPKEDLNSLSKVQILELLEHFKILLNMTQGGILGILKMFTQSPRDFEKQYLPSMPEDELIQSINAIRAKETNVTLYECPNGHPYTIGNCGRPRQEAVCPQCQEVIGGLDYKLSGKGKQVNHEDKTKTGHCIGFPTTAADEEVSRISSLVSKFFMRLVLHMTMYLAASQHPRAITIVLKSKDEMDTSPTFLWKHIQRNLVQIAETLQKSKDDGLFACHMLLCQMSEQQGNHAVVVQDWSSKQNRDHWEQSFISSFVNPLMQDLEFKMEQQMKTIHKATKESEAMMILNEKLPEDYRIHLNNVYSVPDMWKYKTHINMAHLTMNVSSLPATEDANILKLFLTKELDLCQLKHLPEILELQTKLVKRFHLLINLNEANDMKIQDFLNGLDDVEKLEYQQLIARFAAVWKHFKESLKTFAFQLEPKKPPVVLPKEFHNQSIDGKVAPLSMLIPNVHGFGLCSLAVVHKLCDVHNSFVEEYQQITGQRSEEIVISSKTLTASHTICYSVQEDLLPIVQANAKVPVRYGQGSVIEYNYRGIQREINSRFLMRKPRIRLQIALVAYREHFNTDYIHLQKLDAFVKQEPLPNKRQIQEECEALTLMEMNNTLSALDIVIVYLASIGLSTSHHRLTILKYMTDTLKMKDSLGIANAIELKLVHAKYLWIQVSHERAKLLSLHGQEPFDDIKLKFRQPLSHTSKQSIQRYLRQTTNNVDHILDCLYEFILLHVSQETNENDEDYVDESKYPLGYSLEVFVDDDSYQGARVEWGDFPADVTMANTVDTWHLALHL